jgi:hypothetical protein
MFRVRMIYFVLLEVILFSCCAYATPIKGPYFLRQGNMEMGTESNIIYRRDIEDITTKIKSNQYFYCIAYGLFDWLNIEAKFGTGDIANDQHTDQKFYYNYNWGGGYGVRLKVYENNKFKIISGVHHISIHPDPNKNTDGLTHRAILDETQFDASFALKGERLSPYLGGKVSFARLIRRIDGERATLKQEENYGIILGFDYMLKDNLRFNLESRFIDEYAVTCGLNYIF